VDADRSHRRTASQKGLPPLIHLFWYFEWIAHRYNTDQFYAHGCQKRHVGNDQVHIVWNDHYRPYDPKVIKMGFGQVQLVITPLPSALYQIEIHKDPSVRLRRRCALPVNCLR